MSDPASTEHAQSIARQNKWLARSIARPALCRDGPLAGTRFFAKDLFAIEGEVTRAGSAVFDSDPIATSDASLIDSARKSGATLLGTTNMDGLAYGFVSNNPIYGRAENPHDAGRICGGSSGGSAGVVAAGLCDFALGTDTSGSIRVPSAFCGVAGYKPSAGVFDSRGITPLSPTFDRPGLFARDARMLSRVAHCLARPSRLRHDSGTIGKVGLLGGYFMHGLELVVKDQILAFAAALNARAELDLPMAQSARAAAYVLVAYEAAQVYHARLRDAPERFDAETRSRLLAASMVSDAWRKRAIYVQHEFDSQLRSLFDHVDLLLAPCVPMVAPRADALDRPQQSGAPLRASLGQFTQPISLAGCPVVSLPLPTEAGLPTAIQLIGPVGSDAKLLRFAQDITA